MITLSFTLLILRYFLGKKLFEKLKLNRLREKTMKVLLKIKNQLTNALLSKTKPAI